MKPSSLRQACAGAKKSAGLAHRHAGRPGSTDLVRLDEVGALFLAVLGDALVARLPTRRPERATGKERGSSHLAGFRARAADLLPRFAELRARRRRCGSLRRSAPLGVQARRTEGLAHPPRSSDCYPSQPISLRRKKIPEVAARAPPSFRHSLQAQAQGGESATSCARKGSCRAHALVRSPGNPQEPSRTSH